MPRRGSLVVGEGIEDPGHLHQVGPVVAVQGVELEATSKPSRLRWRGRPTSASRSGARTSTTPERRTSWRATFSSASLVGRPPLVSSGARLTGLRPAASRRPSSSRGVDEFEQVGQHRHALQPGRSAQLGQPGTGHQVREEPGRAQPGRGQSRGCPVGTTSALGQVPGPTREVEWPPTRNSSPAVGASSRSSSSQRAEHRHCSRRRLPHPHRSAGRPMLTSRAATRVHPPAVEPGSEPEGQKRPGCSPSAVGGLAEGGRRSSSTSAAV